MRFKPKEAFSIIELLAVLFIVSISLVGVLVLAHNSIRAQRLNKHNLIAYQLAQEGIELVRVFRDNNWLQDSFTFEEMFSGQEYCIDYISLNLEANSEPCDLYYLNNFYQHLNGDNPNAELSPYSRLIKMELITELPDGSGTLEDHRLAVAVSAHIYWQELGNTFEYVTATELYDWK